MGLRDRLYLTPILVEWSDNCGDIRSNLFELRRESNVKTIAIDLYTLAM